MGPLLESGKRGRGVAIGVWCVLFLSRIALAQPDLITPLLPLLANGDLATAISELEVMVRPASPELHRGEQTPTTLPAGRHDVPPATPPAPIESIHLLAGRFSYRVGDLPRALLHFEQASKNNFPLSDHAELWLVKTLNRLGRPADALQHLPEPLDKDPSLLATVFFWETVRARIGLREWGEALRLIGLRTKEKKEDPEEETQADFFEGLILWKQGLTHEASKIWKKILLTNARDPLEEEILDLYASREINPLTYFSGEDWLKRADNLADRGFPSESLDVIRRLELTGHRVRMARARFTFRARRYNEAALLLEGLLTEPETGTDRSEVRSLLATTYVRSDQFDRALQLHDEIVSDNSASPAARRSRDKLPAILFDAGEYDKAREAYSKILEKNPRDVNARWFRFWSSYLMDDFSTAIEDIGSLEATTRSKEGTAKIRYWKGRSVERLGRKEDAQKIFVALGDNQSSPFYASLARQRLSSRPLNTRTLVDLPNDIIPAAVPVPHHNSPLPPPQMPPLPFPSPSRGEGIREGVILRGGEGELGIPEDDPLHRAFLLAQIGMSREAYDESERSPLLATELEPKQVALLFKRAHNFKQMSVIGGALFKQANDPSAERETRFLQFPKAYEEWTRFFSERHQVDEKLVWSMMKQESSFKPAVESTALAFGLMQIIPETGFEAARELKRKDFHPEDLKDPLTSIEFGTWYVRKLLDTFDGSVIHAVAAYNAGPEAVTRWLRWGKDLEPDEFIELIPYKETSEYVKRVMRNYWMYVQLYDSPSPSMGEGRGEGGVQ